MGMTDKQFNGYLRFILSDLAEIKKLALVKEPDINSDLILKINELIEKLTETMKD